MANGYGGSSGSSGSSSPSGASARSNLSVNAPQQRRVNDQGQLAPEGFHYMPDGTLMSDVEHAKLYSVKAIKNFNLDFSDLPAAGETRTFNILGDKDAEFILEVKDNATGNYYNFNTNTFQSGVTNLEDVLTTQNYEGTIKFPSLTSKDTVNGDFSGGATAITMDTAVASTMAVGDRVTGNDALNNAVITVASIDSTNVFSLSSSTAIDDGTTLGFTGNAQYDIFLYAKPGTRHANYREARFGDNTIDLNSSIGSNSLMMQKVMYQYADVTFVINKLSPNGTVAMTGTGHGTTVINVPRSGSKGKTPFTVTASVASTGSSYQIIKQPDINDIISAKTITIGSAPETLPNENIYPTARTAFDGDDVNGAITSGSVVRMDNTDLSAAIAVGDKITSPKTTSTVDGNFEDTDKFVIDDNCATVMAVGDQVTGFAGESRIVVVKTINPDGDNVKEFDVEQEGGAGVGTTIGDGKQLTFESKVNRSLTTVTVVETSGSATDFTMSQAIQFRDDQPLTFTPQANYQWPVDDISGIPSGALLKATNAPAGTTTSDYSDITTISEGTANEQTIVNYQAPFKTTKGQKATITNGVVTAQPGNLVFSAQCPLVLASDSIDVLGFGGENIINLTGYDVSITDLKIELVPITFTSTAVCNSTTLSVSSVLGIIPNATSISGIGVNAALANPTVTARTATTGTGDLTLSSTQVLENGATFNVIGSGQKAIISGNIEIIRAGTGTGQIYFDVEKLLSVT